MRRRGEYGTTIRSAIADGARSAYDSATAGPRAAIATARSGYRGGRAAYRSVRDLQQIGARQRNDHTIVGAAWWHSVGDRKAVLASLSSDYRTFAQEVAAAATAQPEPQRSANLAWIGTSVTPTLDGWAAFAATEAASWWTMAATDWEAFKSWRDRLVRLRELALARGITISSPQPAELPRTVWEAGADGTGGAAAAWLGVLKIAVVGAIGVTGAVAMYSAVRDLTRGTRG